MIKRKKIQQYLFRQLNGIQNNLAEINDNIKKETLHELRLHSKKVKAVTAFLQESLHKKKKYSIKELKELFHHTGDIRTAQINLETIKNAGIKNEAFENDQQTIIDRKARELLQKTNEYSSHISCLVKKLEPGLNGVKNKKAILFYCDNIKLLSNNLRVINETQLHDNRKIIKKLLYNLKLLPAPVAKKLQLNKGYLDNLQDLIGKWQDTLITLEQLNKAGYANEKYLERLQNNKNNLLQKVINEAANFDANVILEKSKTGNQPKLYKAFMASQDRSFYEHAEE